MVLRCQSLECPLVPLGSGDMLYALTISTLEKVLTSSRLNVKDWMCRTGQRSATLQALKALKSPHGLLSPAVPFGNHVKWVFPTTLRRTYYPMLKQMLKLSLSCFELLWFETSWFGENGCTQSIYVMENWMSAKPFFKADNLASVVVWYLGRIGLSVGEKECVIEGGEGIVTAEIWGL